MIIDYILSFFEGLQLNFLNILPVIASPSFYTEYFPQILDTIMSFNDYLPVVEAIQTVLICITTTFAWKIVKVALSLFIDLNA